MVSDLAHGLAVAVVLAAASTAGAVLDRPGRVDGRPQALGARQAGEVELRQYEGRLARRERGDVARGQAANRAVRGEEMGGASNEVRIVVSY